MMLRNHLISKAQEIVKDARKASILTEYPAEVVAKKLNVSIETVKIARELRQN